jgi:hypothetical protein
MLLTLKVLLSLCRLGLFFMIANDGEQLKQSNLQCITNRFTPLAVKIDMHSACFHTCEIPQTF